MGNNAFYYGIITNKRFYQKQSWRIGVSLLPLGLQYFAEVNFLPIFGLMLFLRDDQLYAIPKPWVFITLIVQVLSMLILAIGFKQTGAMKFLGLHVIMGEKELILESLNKSGFYKYVRHPLYSAGLVFLWCSPVMTANFLVVLICLSIYIVIGAIFEERKLVIEHGDNYRIYRKKVPMLIPRFKWNKNK